MTLLSEGEIILYEDDDGQVHSAEIDALALGMGCVRVEPEDGGGGFITVDQIEGAEIVGNEIHVEHSGDVRVSVSDDE